MQNFIDTKVPPIAHTKKGRKETTYHTNVEHYPFVSS